MSFYMGSHDFDNGDGGKTSTGKCIEKMYRRDGSEYVCNTPHYSVMHPPNQFRHWCSALEQGFDCMHFEAYDEGE